MPDEIGLLQNLIRLDVSNNSLTNLPNSLSCLSHLSNLQLEGNSIKSIRRDIIACGTQRILRTLRDRSGSSVKIGNSNLCSKSEDPEKLFPNKYQMKKNQSLTLCGKKLKEIPSVVFQEAKEAHVKNIDLSKNQLSKLPKCLLETSEELLELNMSKNFLTEIQPFVSKLLCLQFINISCNQLEILPAEFGLLKMLRELNVANNK